MIWLLLGLILWTGVHFFKRVAPGPRQTLQDSMGEASKGVIAVALLASIVLMVIGYRTADSSIFWDRSAATTGVNNLMMLASVALFGLGSSKSRLRKYMRHPMLWGTVVWALAHLLVNGDSTSFLLFGGIGIWALVEMVLINRSDAGYVPYDGGSVAGDIRLAVIALVVYSVIAGIHTWLGYMPFGS